MIKTTGRASQLWTRSERTVHIHLKKHLHLTNFIHLKYHSHMQKFKMKLEMENSSEMCLIRELSMLKKSRSLRDPSTSPSWKSGSFLQKFEKNHRKGQPRVPYDYQPSVEGVGSALSKSGASDAVHKGRDTIDEGDESSEREGWVEISPGDGKQLLVTHVLPCQGSESEKQGGDQMQLILECPSGGSLLHNWNFQRGSSHLFNVFTQGNTGEEDGPAYAHQESSKDGIFSKDNDNLDSEKDMSTIGSSESGIRSIAKSNAHKSKGIRGHSVPGAVHAFSSEDGLSWRALALLDRASANTSGKMDELEISEIPQNGCGIPWTWSGIHLRGKYAQDIAGRGVTCGLSGPLSKSLDKPSSKEQLSFSEESTPNTSEFSDSTLNTGSESFPLLEHGVQSDTASPSEAGIMEHIGHSYPGSKFAFSKRKEKKCLRKSVLSNEKSHQCLSEKYSPKSFQEIVGQALITQALSNALLKGKIASVYIFHGPQGTGKSSCARIFAVALNCKSVEEQKPCGSCSECLAFRYGNMSIVKEFAAGGLQGSKGMKKFIHEVNRTTSSRFRVYIVDECHVLSSQSWNAFMKNVEEVPKNIVFVLCTSSLEHLPHIVISRCQKFIFSKIKETDIIIRLQKIASQEGLEVDMEALKLVASASDGSLRDAEMMLEQLSLLGQKITLTMVQELMGLVSDEKLVDLLDFALSADTVNTVRHLKDLMISGVEPLTLMSQLACLITNILAGGYRIPAGRHRRRFFRKKHLAKEDMERLRQALKILSEAEKQLRGSSDKTTWLTAALLQFAPDQSYLLPSSSADTSFTQSPAGILNANVRAEMNSLYSKQIQLQHQQLSGMVSGTGTEDLSNDMSSSPKASGSGLKQDPVVTSEKKRTCKSRGQIRELESLSDSNHKKSVSSSKSAETDRQKWQTTLTSEFELEELWQRVLDAVHSSSLRKFLQTEGKLMLVTLCKGFAVVVLEFSQPESTSRAERSRTSIAHAFQSTLGCPIDVKVQRTSCGENQPRRLVLSGDQPSGSNGHWQPTWSSGDGKAHSCIIPLGRNMHNGLKMHSLHHKRSQPLEFFQGHSDSSVSQNLTSTSNAVETNLAESSGNKDMPTVASDGRTIEERLESAWAQGSRDGGSLTRNSSKVDQNHHERGRHRQSCADKGRLSLGFVIQQDDSSVDEYNREVGFDYTHESSSHHLRHGAGYGGPANEIASRLEEENLRLESRSGGTLCWKVNEKAGGKVKQVEESPRRSGCLMNICPCSRSEQS